MANPSEAPKLELFCKLQGETVPFIAKANIPTQFGKFTVYGFLEHKTGKEHLAIVCGEIDARKRCGDWRFGRCVKKTSRRRRTG